MMTAVVLTLSMLFSLPLYLCAADSHTDLDSREKYPSPDGNYSLDVQYRMINGSKEYVSFQIKRNDTKRNVLF